MGKFVTSALENIEVRKWCGSGGTATPAPHLLRGCGGAVRKSRTWKSEVRKNQVQHRRRFRRHN